MYPEDRVLVAYVPTPSDFDVICNQGWYRIPQKSAPKGLYAEYYAFYFGRKFGQKKWAIHFYAPRLGHELVTRKMLLPQQPNHPRAEELYYKVQLGPLIELSRPIISLRWRRITFLHSTWDRFNDAVDINDLFLGGEAYVDRLYAALKEKGIQAERNYRVKESGEHYDAPLVIFCRNGRITIKKSQIPQSDQGIMNFLHQIEQTIMAKGGILAQN